MHDYFTTVLWILGYLSAIVAAGKAVECFGGMSKMWHPYLGTVLISLAILICAALVNF